MGLGALDNGFFYLINKGCSNKFLDVFIPVVNRLGEWKVIFAGAAILLFFRKRDLRILGVLLIIGLLVSDLIVSNLKILIARPRPYQVLGDVNLFVKEGGFSFPSGHAANAFVTATILSGYIKKPLYFYIMAIGVAFSRVYLGVHYPSDVLAGALLGIILGVIILQVYKIGKKRLHHTM